MITSRTPHFRREDVADRLLLFHIERLETFGAEGDLLNELTLHRNALMTELVGELQRVLGALEKTKGKSYKTSFRIADFAQFVLRTADAEGNFAEAEAMLNRLYADRVRGHRARISDTTSAHSTCCLIGSMPRARRCSRPGYCNPGRGIEPYTQHFSAVLDPTGGVH